MQLRLNDKWSKNLEEYQNRVVFLFTKNTKTAALRKKTQRFMIQLHLGIDPVYFIANGDSVDKIAKVAK